MDLFVNAFLVISRIILRNYVKFAIPRVLSVMEKTRIIVLLAILALIIGC